MTFIMEFGIGQSNKSNVAGEKADTSMHANVDPHLELYLPSR